MIQQPPKRAWTNTMLLFGTPVFLYDEYCSLNKVHDTSNEQTNLVLNREQNFSSAETNILELESYKEIKNRIINGLNEYVNDLLCIDDKFEFYITQSWLNINPPGTAHHRHNHSNAIISGVYYIDVDDAASITFLTPNSTSNITNNPTLAITPKEWNIANSNSWLVPVKNNAIIYFPSTTLHEVNPNASDKNRISLAFNCFVKGTFGDKQTLNELKL
jgi:uncharacterized protein (TIGR02466 family)